VTYQPEFCHVHNEKPEGCQKPKGIWDRLTIHGLWPNNDDGSYPQHCSNEEFDLSSLAQIRDDLEQRWPNIKALPESSSHGEFWEHEWSKHGTCTGLSQLDYFSHALQKLIPTPSIVKDAEENHSLVSRDMLLEAYGGVKRVALVCDKEYLSEVRVCHQKEMNGNVGERMECPESILKESSCGIEIRIASFMTIMGREEESGLSHL
jgi:ribonuclease T2